jgi:hypothetical protein
MAHKGRRPDLLSRRTVASICGTVLEATQWRTKASPVAEARLDLMRAASFLWLSNWVLHLSGKK